MPYLLHVCLSANLEYRSINHFLVEYESITIFCLTSLYSVARPGQARRLVDPSFVD